MRALVNTGPGRLERREWPMPEPGPGQVRIRTLACGICATDLEMIAGWARTGFPAIPGHEWAGRVDATGPGVDACWRGRRCVAENVWAAGGEVGFEHPGGYAEYFVTEAALLRPLPEDCPAHLAVLAEPLAVAMRGLARLGSVAGARVLVLGDGPIGLLMIRAARAAGAGAVDALGGRPGRLARAQAFGAARVLNYHELGADLAAGMKARGWGPYEAVVEASGAGAAVEAGLDVTARGGRLLVMGDYGNARAGFLWNRVLHNETTVIGSNASAGGWSGAVQALLDWRADLENMVTHRLPADRYAEGLAWAGARGGDVVKVVLEWEGVSW